MKTSINIAMTLATSIAGVLAPANVVLAAPTIHQTSVCHSLDQNQAKDLVINTEGVRNISTTPRMVICPLVVTHSQTTTGGVLVDYRTPLPFSTSITCTLYSYSYGGSFMGSKTSTSGLSLNPFISLIGVPADIFSNHAVVCSLPPNSSGRIIGIESNF
jgi:hypothetical protein